MKKWKVLIGPFPKPGRETLYYAILRNGARFVYYGIYDPSSRSISHYQQDFTITRPRFYLLRPYIPTSIVSSTLAGYTLFCSSSVPRLPFFLSRELFYCGRYACGLLLRSSNPEARLSTLSLFPADGFGGVGKKGDSTSPNESAKTGG